jgi:hypothetical protein
MRRPSYVAGYFYPDDPEILKKTIGSFIREKSSQAEAIGAVCPHAGYEFSGPVAASVYASVEIPQTVVILAPAHQRILSLFALFDQGSWLTPLGEVEVEGRLAELIVSETDLVSRDLEAHRKEHSIEVQIPFLQYFRPDVSIVPIMVSYEAGYPELSQLGQALTEAVKKFQKQVLLIASTDMSHYVNKKVAEELDYKAIFFIEKLDPRGLFDVVTSYGISMCGFQPTTALLTAARGLGAKEGRLIKYQTSGERTGDYREVVGYAGLIIY